MTTLPITKQYNIIYADPPWDGLGYNKVNSRGEPSGKRAPANYYQVQSDKWIWGLNVPRLAAPDCALFLWATYPNLPVAIETVAKWGFRYATVAFTWVKTNKDPGSYFMGCGNYTRANPEICLLGIKGSMRRKSAKVRNLLVSSRQAHSRKPDETRARIVELFGDVSRIELFARERVAGWDAWGDQLPPSETCLLKGA